VVLSRSASRFFLKHGSSFRWFALLVREAHFARCFLCMPLVRQYSRVRKNDLHGKLQTFTPLRAVGLAVEEGHRFCKSYGLGRLSGAATGELTGQMLENLYKLI
jgi:hypothetical protein